jgi:hypothetical protein
MLFEHVSNIFQPLILQTYHYSDLIIIKILHEARSPNKFSIAPSHFYIMQYELSYSSIRTGLYL